jgi:glycine cleavage system H protein
LADIRYTRDHEYVRLEGDVATVGITDYAQGQLGDVVFVDLPAIGKKVTKGGEAAVVESVKAASEVYAPVTGEIVAVNEALTEAPATVNEDATGKGWFIRIRVADAGELADLMDQAAYEAYVASLG